MPNNQTMSYPCLEKGNLKVGAIIISLLLIAPAIMAFISGRNLIGLIALLAPLPFLFMTNLRWSFYLFLISLCVQFTFKLSWFSLHPYDLTMGILFFAVIIDFLLHGRNEIRSTNLDRDWGFLIGATLISGVLAHNPAVSIIPIIRIIIIYMAYRVVFKLATELSVRRILVWFIWAMTILSGINIILFLYYGGAVRIFGLMSTPYNGFCITSLPIAVAFYIWSRNKQEQFWFGLSVPIMLMGIFATQSRAPMLSLLITLPILLWIARKKIAATPGSSAGVRIRKLFFWIGLLAVPIVVVGGTLFIPMLDRISRLIDSISEPRGTIALRIVLWTAAIKGFLTSPITGIGIGNYQLIDQVVPEIRISPVYYYIRGMTAHSIVLQYLVETGLIGILALSNLAYRGIKIANQSFSLSKSDNDNQVSAALLIASIVFAVSMFFIGFWTWTQGGYLLAIIFALNAVWFKSKKRTQTNSQT